MTINNRWGHARPYSAPVSIFLISLDLYLKMQHRLLIPRSLGAMYHLFSTWAIKCKHNCSISSSSQPTLSSPRIRLRRLEWPWNKINCMKVHKSSSRPLRMRRRKTMIHQTNPLSFLSSPSASNLSIRFTLKTTKITRKWEMMKPWMKKDRSSRSRKSQLQHQQSMLPWRALLTRKRDPS